MIKLLSIILNDFEVKMNIGPSMFTTLHVAQSVVDTRGHEERPHVADSRSAFGLSCLSRVLTFHATASFFRHSTVYWSTQSMLRFHKINDRKNYCFAEKH